MENIVEINKIYNEDCFITMSNMEDNLVDIVMTSPPYNMTARKGGYSDSGRYDVYEDWMTESEYIDFTIRLFNNFNRVVKENGVVLYNFSYSIENPSLPYKLVAYKCAPQSNMSLGFSNTGDPASITVTCDLLADGDDNILDLILIEE